MEQGNGKEVTIYYAFCPPKAGLPGEYLEYQRKLADRILSYGFQNSLGIEFDRGRVAKGEKGKPYWAGEEGIVFNVSNTDGLVACGVSAGGTKDKGCAGDALGSAVGFAEGKRAGGLAEDRHGWDGAALSQKGNGSGKQPESGGETACFAVGVDAEKPRKVRMPLLRKCCSPEEIGYILGIRPSSINGSHGRGPLDAEKSGKQEGLSYCSKDTMELKEGSWERFSQIWTLKESYIKMTGEGLSFPLEEVNFRIGGQGKGGCNIWCSQPAYFSQKQIGEYWVSVCTRERAEIVWEELPIAILQ